MQGGCDGSTLPTANRIPVCQSFIVYKRRGRRGNVALFYSLKTKRLMVPARRWKRSLQLYKQRGLRMGAVYPRQTNTCLPIFCSLQAERATRQRRPFLQHVTWQLRLPAHRWKRSLQFCCPQVALRKRPLFQRQSTS